MRALLVIAIASLAVVSLPAAQSSGVSGRSGALEQAFVANGKIRMDLSAGEYRISASPDNQIRLQWTVREPEQARRVRARADVNGAEAVISTAAPHNSNFHATIAVPARTDLEVWLTAGDLTVEHVEGNKNISSHAGEIDIDVGQAASYSRVEASVWAGELHPGPFGRPKEGLFRSFDWTGTGPYRLEAHLKAGELRLHGSADQAVPQR